ncbi:MAG: DUF3656 domain-containing protein [Rubripirellula sp.]
MNATSTRPADRPIELLSPAGDWDCVRAAIENGADAVYFGLDCGFNARHRAKNFGLADLPDLSELLRSRGVRGYVTMNTLVFPSEMKALVEVVEKVAESGLDAVLVQDFGVARLVREICPELEVHASTQMSLTSAETIEVARDLGLARAVLARELSVEEIRSIAALTDMPLEVFIHGALCVAYSGQCLTSESLGGRSANRGQCAQACRLPYELICDGEDRDLGDVRYLLSPQDLAGYAAIPDLIAAGVDSLKIEGRLKTPEYVANITQHYRAAIDEAKKSGTVSVNEQAKREMELSFSRGFSPGWLEGNDHKQLVPGRQSAKRGIELGSVIEVGQDELRVRIAAPIALGDGLAINDPDQEQDQGGRIYSLENEQGQQKRVNAGEVVWIGFGRGEIDWSRVSLEATVFKNDDPRLNRRLRSSFSGEDPACRQPLDLMVVAETGSPLKLIGRLQVASARMIQVEVAGAEPLSAARNRPADEALLREKLGRLGGTAFELRQFDAQIIGTPMVPMGMLNQLRRDLVSGISARLAEPPKRKIDVARGHRMLEPINAPSQTETESPQLAALCRTLEQLEVACEFGVDLVYADFHDVREYGQAVQVAKSHDTKIGLASVRIQKPKEMGLIKILNRHRPDLVLARNLAVIGHCKTESIPMIADFSMNISNHRSAEWIRSWGVERLTASYDLNREQLFELVESLPSAWLEVVIHQHMPMFHMEHCVFCSVLSPGTNKTNCGRPCDDHVVQLRDRVGAEHTLQADVACRNTLYNATPQSGAETVSELISQQVGWFRVELLSETAGQAKTVLDSYRQLLDGRLSGQEVWQRLQATNRVGVTRGTLETKRNPLAIL